MHINGTHGDDYAGECFESGPSDEERLASAANDYETLDPETLADLGF